MNVIEQIVPSEGVKYISEWKDYVMPKGHVIVDKGVTGCGYTEYCLRNNQNIVLCSPRKLLLQNKAEQHLGDLNILYLENDIKDHSGVRGWREKIKKHLEYCRNPFNQQPVKFLVTYDSLRHVIGIFKELGVNLEDFIFVVDEFQSIFLDSFFKASTEFNFVEYLQDCPNVLYLSATPMLEEYLDRTEEFKDLPYYKLDWSKTKFVETIKISRQKASSISGSCVKVIKKFQSGNYPTALDNSGKPVESKEAVFYLNSITDIIRVIRKAGLKPSEVNIICSDTDDNKERLRVFSKSLGYDSGKGFKIGKVPLQGQANKKYTFCTRSVYIGADFHSDNASSYVFADPNLKCLALDISLDLPQIVGRQRNRNNPFKNQVTLFYRTIQEREIQSWEKFQEIQQERLESTNKLLNLYQKADSGEKVAYIRKLRSDIQVSQYSEDFVSISDKTGQPVHNKFIELADERAWKVSQKDYQDSITVTKALESEYEVQDCLEEENKVFLDFKVKFDGFSFFTDKMRVYCEFMDTYKDSKHLIYLISSHVTEPDYGKFYEYYGTRGCISVGYKKGELEKGMSDQGKLLGEVDLVISSFVVGEKYTKSDIKQKLISIYASLGLSKKAKATDIEDYYEVKPVLIPNKETGKRDKGYLIISRK